MIGNVEAKISIETVVKVLREAGLDIDPDQTVTFSMTLPEFLGMVTCIDRAPSIVYSIAGRESIDSLRNRLFANVPDIKLQHKNV